jgi:hypothetical protein
MSNHDDRISLAQMFAYAQDAERFSGGRLRVDLDTDRMLYLPYFVPWRSSAKRPAGFRSRYAINIRKSLGRRSSPYGTA